MSDNLVTSQPPPATKMSIKDHLAHVKHKLTTKEGLIGAYDFKTLVSSFRPGRARMPFLLSSCSEPRTDCDWLVRLPSSTVHPDISLLVRSTEWREADKEAAPLLRFGCRPSYPAHSSRWFPAQLGDACRRFVVALPNPLPFTNTSLTITHISSSQSSLHRLSSVYSALLLAARPDFLSSDR
jgi:hypothetical protein